MDHAFESGNVVHNCPRAPHGRHRTFVALAGVDVGYYLGFLRDIEIQYTVNILMSD